MNLNNLRRRVPTLLRCNGLKGLMRNKSRSANSTILGGRVEVLAETGLWRGRSTVVLMAGAYVPHDSNCCPDQNEEAGNRNGKEDLHHQKDIKAYARWGIPRQADCQVRFE